MAVTLVPLLVCHRQADISFVVDSSGSINDADRGNFDRVKKFMKNIVQELEVGEYQTRIGKSELLGICCYAGEMFEQEKFQSRIISLPHFRATCVILVLTQIRNHLFFF